MKPFDLAAVKDALNRHCVNPDNGQFMPKPADVVKLLQGSSQDGALVAWAKVDRAVRQVGTYSTVVFDDPIIHRVVQDMGGWVALGDKREKEWPFVAKEFENRYRGYPMRSFRMLELVRHVTRGRILEPRERDAARKAVQRVLEALVAAGSVQVSAPATARGTFAEYSVSHKWDTNPPKVGREVGQFPRALAP